MPLLQPEKLEVTTYTHSRLQRIWHCDQELTRKTSGVNERLDADSIIRVKQIGDIPLNGPLVIFNTDAKVCNEAVSGFCKVCCRGVLG